MTNGKICYIEMPATDVARSAAFYADVFGWRLRTRSNGSTAFDDTTGQVGGSYVRGRDAADAPGLLLYIMVDDIEQACRDVVMHGGAIMQPVGFDAPELTARFRDPGGNIIGLYQEPVRAE